MLSAYSFFRGVNSRAVECTACLIQLTILIIRLSAAAVVYHVKYYLPKAVKYLPSFINDFVATAKCSAELRARIVTCLFLSLLLSFFLCFFSPQIFSCAEIHSPALESASLLLLFCFNIWTSIASTFSTDLSSPHLFPRQTTCLILPPPCHGASNSS